MGYFKAEQLKKLELKSNPAYWVEIIADLRYGELKKFASITKDGEVDFQTSADLFLQTVIKNWNLDDEEGTVLPITAENIDKLNKDDAVMILEQAGGLVDDESQKKSSQSK